MKHLILIAALYSVATGAYAQSDPIFRADNSGTPTAVYKLGANPEFPAIRNKTTPDQVAEGMKAADRRQKAKMNEFLTQIGFANGVADVTADNIAQVYVPDGTVGNMGDGNFSSMNVKLMGGDQGTRAWKVTAPNGSYVYFLAKCGNAFYPAKSTACISVPVNLTNDSKEVTLTNAATRTNTDQVFVYYHRKRHKRHDKSFVSADIPDNNPSRPLALASSSSVEALPTTYKVSVTSADNTVVACPDKTLDVATSINVEKTSEYTGYYPGKSDKEYKRVSKRAYKKAMRKMAKVEKKERKAGRTTGVVVKL